MEYLEKLGNYFSIYKNIIFISSVYAIALSLLGVFLIWKKSSLFSLVLSKISSVAFILAMGIHSIMHSHEPFSFLQGSVTNWVEELRLLDLKVFPLVILLTSLMIYFLHLIRKVKISSETFFTIAFIALTSLLPLLYKIFGANQQILQNIYFTEILYTPMPLFYYYLGHIFVIGFLLFIFSPVFIQVNIDPIQAKLHSFSTFKWDFFFFILASSLFAISGRVIGIYLSISLTLVPSFLAIYMFKKKTHIFIATAGFSILFNLTGFVFIFLFDQLPSEPVMILQMLFFSMIVIISYQIKAKK